MLAVLTIIVLQRYTGIGTFDSGSELCSLTFPIFVMAGIVDAARKGAHVATQILLNALDSTWRIVLVVFLHGITAIAYFYLCWYAYQNALIAHDELSTILQVPGSLGYGSLTVGLFLVGLCSLGAIVRHTLGHEPVHVNLRITSYNVCYTKLLRQMPNSRNSPGVPIQIATCPQWPGMKLSVRRNGVFSRRMSPARNAPLTRASSSGCASSFPRRLSTRPTALPNNMLGTNTPWSFSSIRVSKLIAEKKPRNNFV